MKLPAFYLLDMISKNVYEPYARQFAPFVSSLFLEAYTQVDQNTRSKMEEMLLTWRTGHDGKELFGVAQQISIERGVWGGAPSHPDVRSYRFHSHGVSNSLLIHCCFCAPQPSTGFYSGQGQISKGQVLRELEFTLGQKERAIQANPYDSALQQQVNILRQLRKMVETGVSSDELRQILTQLRSFSQSSAPPPPPHAPPYPPAAAATPPFNTHPTYPSVSYPLQPPKMESVNLASLLSKAQGTVASSSTAAPIGNITNLYNTLLKAGLVSATGTPTGACETAKADESKSEPLGAAKASAREYRKLILGQKIKLTSVGITRYAINYRNQIMYSPYICRSRPDIVHLLYDRLPIQCKQCGIRFADDSAGKLDMHFRQNRKANQNMGRGHSCSWFVTLEVRNMYF